MCFLRLVSVHVSSVHYSNRDGGFRLIRLKVLRSRVRFKRSYLVYGFLFGLIPTHRGGPVLSVTRFFFLIFSQITCHGRVSQCQRMVFLSSPRLVSTWFLSVIYHGSHSLQRVPTFSIQSLYHFVLFSRL